MTQEDDEPQEHPRRIANPEQQFVAVGDKDLRKLQKKAWNAGWWPEQRKKGILWMAPDEVGQVMVHGSSSDHHATRNLTSQFRNAGLEV